MHRPGEKYPRRSPVIARSSPAFTSRPADLAEFAIRLSLGSGLRLFRILLKKLDHSPLLALAQAIGLEVILTNRFPDHLTLRLRQPRRHDVDLADCLLVETKRHLDCHTYGHTTILPRHRLIWIDHARHFPARIYSYRSGRARGTCTKPRAKPGKFKPTQSSRSLRPPSRRKRHLHSACRSVARPHSDLQSENQRVHHRAARAGAQAGQGKPKPIFAPADLVDPCTESRSRSKTISTPPASAPPPPAPCSTTGFPKKTPTVVTRLERRRCDLHRQGQPARIRFRRNVRHQLFRAGA